MKLLSFIFGTRLEARPHDSLSSDSYMGPLRMSK
jgi:hypothetical protein